MGSHMAAFVGPLIKSRASVVYSKNHLIPLLWNCEKGLFSPTHSRGRDWMSTNGAAATSKICHGSLTALINSWSLIHPSPVVLCSHKKKIVQIDPQASASFASVPTACQLPVSLCYSINSHRTLLCLFHKWAHLPCPLQSISSLRDKWKELQSHSPPAWAPRTQLEHRKPHGSGGQPCMFDTVLHPKWKIVYSPLANGKSGEVSSSKHFCKTAIGFIGFCLFVLGFETHLLQLFRRTLQCYFAVQLQKCFVDEETVADLSSAWWYNDYIL